MNALRIRKKVDSETLHIPELRAFMGQTVEIIVLDDSENARPPGNWQALAAIAGQDLIDPEVYREYRDFDRDYGNGSAT